MSFQHESNQLPKTKSKQNPWKQPTNLMREKQDLNGMEWNEQIGDLILQNLNK